MLTIKLAIHFRLLASANSLVLEKVSQHIGI